MSISGTVKLVSALGGNLDKNDVFSTVEQYEKYYTAYGGGQEMRTAQYTDLVNKFYDLITSIYEYALGESFHMAPRWKGETMKEGRKRYEHFIALQLGLKPGQKVLDVGCGIGGPLREIARFSLATITGLNNNPYQISRCKELNRIARIDETCIFVKADFMKMPFPDNSFDAVYSIEATCHAPDNYGCYKEIYRVLKPGQLFAAYEWCMTESFNPESEEHQNIKAEIELGNGLTDIRTIKQCVHALEKAGFEIVWEKDVAVGAEVPWYSLVDPTFFSFGSFRESLLGVYTLRAMVRFLEFIRVAPQGSVRVEQIIRHAAHGLTQGGKKEIFTPMYFFLARKPASD